MACRGPSGLVKQLGTYNCQRTTGTRGLSRASFHRRLPVLPKRRRQTGWLGIRVQGKPGEILLGLAVVAPAPGIGGGESQTGLRT